jgi:uncharacterized protein (DUF885 family)
MFHVRALLVSLCLSAAAVSHAQSVQDFFRETWEERLRDEPEFAARLGRHEYDGVWTDYSRPARDQRRMRLERRLAEASRIDTAKLTPQEKLSLRLLAYDLRVRLDAWDATVLLLPVGQLFGLHNNVYQAFDGAPARTVGDYENQLLRLRAIPRLIDQRLATLDEAIARRMTQPKPVLDLVMRQVAQQIAQTPDDSALLESFRRFPANIPAGDRQRLQSQAIAAYQASFLPAWKKLYAYLETKYLPAVRPGIAVTSLQQGRETYGALIRSLTTTSMTPGEIHNLGLAEVKRLEGEMQALLKQAGFTGSISEYERKLAADPAQHFQSKEEMLAYCRNIAKIIEPQLPNQFKRIPMLLYGIRAIPPDREAATASNAQSPAPDFSRPGWFNLNAYQPEKQVKYTKESLVLHEAVPGHIFQGTLAQGLADLPEFRRFYSNSAYGEGWALYVESLGAELGVYRDPASRFGQLTSERFRAVRLVVDTGMHALGWPKEKALDYFSTHAPDASTSEIDRYISWPAQSLSYKLGQLKIRELRTFAEQKLGSRFDVREFHDVVLRDGRLPLELLDEQVKEYVRTAGGR